MLWWFSYSLSKVSTNPISSVALPIVFCPMGSQSLMTTLPILLAEIIRQSDPGPQYFWYFFDSIIFGTFLFIKKKHVGWRFGKWCGHSDSTREDPFDLEEANVAAVLGAVHLSYFSSSFIVFCIAFLARLWITIRCFVFLSCKCHSLNASRCQVDPFMRVRPLELRLWGSFRFGSFSSRVKSIKLCITIDFVICFFPQTHRIWTSCRISPTSSRCIRAGAATRASLARIRSIWRRPTWISSLVRVARRTGRVWYRRMSSDGGTLCMPI